MTDARPANCRFRLQDEGKSYPRSSCAACGRGIGTGLGTFCQSALAPGYTPEILASSPEVAALIREAEDRGMERAAGIARRLTNDTERAIEREKLTIPQTRAMTMVRDTAMTIEAAVLAEAAVIRAAKATP